MHAALVTADAREQLAPGCDPGTWADLLALLAYGVNLRSRAGADARDLGRTVTAALASLGTLTAPTGQRRAVCSASSLIAASDPATVASQRAATFSPRQAPARHGSVPSSLCVQQAGARGQFGPGERLDDVRDTTSRCANWHC